jgi:hypothetical protein
VRWGAPSASPLRCWALAYPPTGHVRAAAADRGVQPGGSLAGRRDGPYEPEDWFPEDQQGPFDIVLSVTPDGIVYMDEYNGELSPDGCTLSGFGRIEADCEELQDDTFCTFVDRIFELDFTQVPATGTVTLELSGEGDALATAPLEAVAVP